MALLSNLTALKAQSREARALKRKAEEARMEAAKAAPSEDVSQGQQATDAEAFSPERHLANALETQLVLPLSNEPPEESCRIRVQDRGQFLSRQERWEELSHRVCKSFYCVEYQEE